MGEDSGPGREGIPEKLTRREVSQEKLIKLCGESDGCTLGRRLAGIFEE